MKRGKTGLCFLLSYWNLLAVRYGGCTAVQSRMLQQARMYSLPPRKRGFLLMRGSGHESGH